MFKVVPDQMRVSEGWVRCGKCEEIFDAAANLQEEAAPPPDAPGGDSPDTVPFEGALAAAMATDAQPRRTAGAGGRAPDEPDQPAPAALDFELREPRADAGLVLEPALPSAHLLPEGSAYGVADAQPQAEPAASGRGIAAPEQARPASELSFMRDANRSSRWHRPLVRATLMVFALLLALGLAVQVLVHERDRVVAFEPGLRPLVEDVCLLLGCRVAALRQIESVVIDSSAFSKTRSGAYRLSLTLKNTAPIDLAMPAVELALTDTLDHPLLRRVFQPEELGVKSGVIPAASEIQSTLVLTLRTNGNGNGNGERVAGYRLLAFYP
jgi:hypothetical protein